MHLVGYLRRLQEQAAMTLSLVAAIQRVLPRRRRHGARYPHQSWLFESIVDMVIDAVPDHEQIEVNDIRALFARTATLPMLTPVHCEPIRLGTVPGERQSPRITSAGRTILFFHGGGYVAGSVESHRLLSARIAKEASAQLYSMAYRLAPEHPYPAALEDAWIAYWTLLARGVLPRQIVIGGDSAGAGLTVALLLALREAHVPLPAAAFCLSPLFDLRCGHDTPQAKISADYLNPNVLRCSAHSYLNGLDPCHPYVSPIFADLQGLPPILIQAGRTEFLVNDAIQFTERAAAAGVDVRLHLAEQMIHVYQFLYPIVREAKEAVKEIGHFVRQQTM